jgi:hypothetical protein
MFYQNPAKFEDEITLIEFDRKPNQDGNHYVTYAEWTDKYGDTHAKYVSWDDEIPDHIRIQIALQVAGDLVTVK